MITLQDYLGSLVSSITTARVATDLLTTRVAEDYAKNRLLEHFPVPRMRIQNVELTVPVAIEEAEPADREPLDKKRFAVRAYREIRDVMGIASLPLVASRAIKAALAEQTQQLEEEAKKDGSDAPLENFAKVIAAKAVESVTLPETPKVQSKLAERLRELVQREIKIRPMPRRLETLRVAVEADKLREKKPENLVFIKLNISEDGVEWHKMETAEGRSVSKLLPE